MPNRDQPLGLHGVRQRMCRSGPPVQRLLLKCMLAVGLSTQDLLRTGMLGIGRPTQRLLRTGTTGKAACWLYVPCFEESLEPGCLALKRA